MLDVISLLIFKCSNRCRVVFVVVLLCFPQMINDVDFTVFLLVFRADSTQF